MSVSPDARWRLGPDLEFELDHCRVMGILNVTSDSFSDGGLYEDVDRAIGRSVAMVDEGASMIDVGGESTRPGAAPVTVEQQLSRVIPVIKGIRRLFDVPISIDTTSAHVAQQALDAGADAINDVSAGMDDPGMFALAAERGCGLVLMHRLCRPAEDSWSDAHESEPEYGDLVGDVHGWLLERARLAEESGVQPASIVIDPGLGFGKNVEQNARLIAAVGSFVQSGYPVLCAASRKSFIGAVTGQSDPEERMVGSVAIAIWEAARGVRLFRVHDVSAHVGALAAYDRGHGLARSLGTTLRALSPEFVQADTMSALKSNS
jgi:dihydropteroate synthase